MKNNIKRLLLIAFAAILLAGAFPVRSQAINSKVTNYERSLKKGAFTPVKKSESHFNSGTEYRTNNYYKFTVPSNKCYVKLESKNKASLFIYRKVKKNKYEQIAKYEDSKEHYFALPKGTYYLIAFYENDMVRISCKNVPNKANYSAQTAQTIKKGAKAIFCTGNGYAYDRWYKISLKKSQKLTVYPQYMNGSAMSDQDWTVYGPDGNEVSFGYVKKNSYTSQKKLAKGTYYMRIHCCTGVDSYNGPWMVNSFRWK